MAYRCEKSRPLTKALIQPFIIPFWSVLSSCSGNARRDSRRRAGSGSCLSQYCSFTVGMGSVGHTWNRAAIVSINTTPSPNRVMLPWGSSVRTLASSDVCISCLVANSKSVEAGFEAVKAVSRAGEADRFENNPSRG